MLKISVLNRHARHDCGLPSYVLRCSRRPCSLFAGELNVGSKGDTPLCTIFDIRTETTLTG